MHLTHLSPLAKSLIFLLASGFILRENYWVLIRIWRVGSVIFCFFPLKMGACCSISGRYEGFNMGPEGFDGKESRSENYNHHVRDGENGARVRFQGSSNFVSMYSQQGRKGVNQDTMTVWENFNGEKDMFFAAVFDGHGPSGHEVARIVRDNLPSKLSKQSRVKISSGITDTNERNKDNVDNIIGKDVPEDPLLASWEANFVKSFEDMDEVLCDQESVDTYTSGTTAVTVVKKGDNLVIANLGDSRAVLCTRDDQSQLVPLQLTVDLKPNLPDEAKRIQSCQGRVFAMEEEPEVFRIWMPEENCPGLAMARAFGDFCLKDFGLISTPQVFCRKLIERDEFVVLATDGVWDVLSNDDAIKIVASAKKRSLAARLLVDYAVQAWRHKYPTSRIDDCAVVCLFFKEKPLFTKSVSEVNPFNKGYSEFGAPMEQRKKLKSDDGLDTVINIEVKEMPKESSRRLPRSRSQGMNCRKRVKVPNS